MWISPIFLEEYARQRSQELSQHLSQCRLAEELRQRPAPVWRRHLARHLATLSLRLDDRETRAALAALEARLFMR